ncbi:hypothetical protein M8745_20360, partial [Lutimaribacter sp. EGI FJ00014]|nr:hypothetical protein [Lutimaribacter sp. EGI FJ00014]
MTEAQAGELAEALGDLPLVIDQSAAWIDAHPGADITRYLRALRPDTGAAPEVPAAHRQVWARTLDSLAARSPSVYELLLLLTFFSPDMLPVRLLRSARPSDLPTHLAGPVTEPGSWDSALLTISEIASMRVEFATEAGQETSASVVSLRMHRSFHRFIRDSLTHES